MTPSLISQNVVVKSVKTVPTVDVPNKSITYLTLGTSFAPGTLVITAGNSTSFNYTLPAPLIGRFVFRSFDWFRSRVCLKSEIPASIKQSRTPSARESMASTSRHLLRIFSTWVSLLLAREEMPRLRTTHSGISPMLGMIGTLKIELLTMRMIGLGGYKVLVLMLFYSFLRKFPLFHIQLFPKGEQTLIIIICRLDWVSKDASSYSYSKTIYPGIPLIFPVILILLTSL